MNAQRIQEVLQELGCRSIRPCGDHIRANCPLAPYLHKKGIDRNPSFFVKIENADRSCYHCFSCQSKGTLVGLLYELQRFGSHVDQDLLDRVCLEEKQDPAQKARLRPSIFSKEFLMGQKQHEEERWAEEEYAPYAGKVHKYLIERGVSVATCEAWGIGYDPEKKRVMFPVRRHCDGALVGAVGRTVEKKVEPTYLTYFNFKKSNFLYGEHFLKTSSEPVIGEALGYDLPAQEGVVLVEGMMDVLKLYEMGYGNVAGLMTATISKRQASTLKRVGRALYLMLDWDKAGASGRRGAIKAFIEKSPVYDVPGIFPCSNCGSRWSKINDSGDHVCRECGNLWTLYDTEDTRRFKDPDGLTSEEILDCLSHAKRVKISS